MEPLTGPRADLHVHSKYSNRPSAWFLRRIGAPESFVEPTEVYRRARERGMDFVTISDHNRIEGAAEIAHLPGTFISCEVTTYFPEDRCKIHLLVFGLDEETFRYVDELRPSIYELRDYLIETDLPHSVAHPFFRVNHRLTPVHVEKLLLLFNRFEGLNGARERRASDLVNLVMRSLTPGMMDRMVDQHGIEPHGERPWVKSFTGGSDDHSGLFIAGACTTVAEPTTSVDGFLDQLRAGACELGGQAGSSLRLAHSFYEIAYSYYLDRFGGSRSLVGEVLENLARAGGEAKSGSGFYSRVGGAFVRRRLSDPERLVFDQLRALLAQNPGGPDAAPDRRVFERSAQVVHLLGYRFFDQLVEHLRAGRFLDAFQTFASLAPVGLAVSPYLASFSTQHQDEPFLQDICASFEAAAPLARKGGGVCWATDTFGEVNGVARMIRALGETAERRGRRLDVITSMHESAEFPWVKNFPPVGTFDIDEYPGQTVAFPPFLAMIEAIERRSYSKVVISTPGPVGLTALAAARLLGLETIGIYHTDFPRYVEQYTDQPLLAGWTRQAMAWFYGKMDRVLAPSRAYRDELLEMGLSPQRLGLLRRGVDRELFAPGKSRDRSGSSAGLLLLYVGRLSADKNLDYLGAEFRLLLKQCLESGAAPPGLRFVGDGPSRSHLARELADLVAAGRVSFSGVLEGDALAEAYASADVFVFPSVTDTFGNVVLEAQASGLPAVVSDRGGPQDIVVPGESGVVVAPQPGAFAAALMELQRDPARLRSMSETARRSSVEWTWERVLEDLLGEVDEEAGPSTGVVALAKVLPGTSAVSRLPLH